MSYREFNARIVPRENVCTIRCSGDLDLFASDQLRTLVEVVLKQKARELVLDLSDLALLSSTGVEDLFYAARRCRERGARFNVRTGDAARRVLDLLDLWWVGVIDDGFAAEWVMRGVRHDDLANFQDL